LQWKRFVASSLSLRPPPFRAWFSFPTLSLSRARLEFSSSFPFWFLLLFPFPRSSPLFCFSSRDVSPLLFVYFFSRHLLHLDAGMNCGSDMFLSFAVFSQSSIFEPSYVYVSVQICSKLSHSKKTSLMSVCHGIAAQVIRKGRHAFFIQNKKLRLLVFLFTLHIFHVLATSSDNCLSKHDDCVEKKGIRFF